MLSRLVLAAPRVGVAALARHPAAAAAAPSIPGLRMTSAGSTSLLARLYSQNSNKNAQDKDGNAAKASSSSEPVKDTTTTPESTANQAPEQQPEQIPFHKLPDLTHGIPSTLAEDMAQRAGQKYASHLQIFDDGGGGGYSAARRKRDPYGSYESGQQMRRQKLLRIVFILTAVGGVVSLLVSGRNWADEVEAQRHPEAPNGFGLGLWWARARARAVDSVTYYQEPTFDKLLPDPQPFFARRYTLCLSLEDLLVHSEWSRQHGWRVAKRPGLDYFLLYLSQYYELVIFTTSPSFMVDNLMQKMDPHHIVMWKLYREATKFEDGEVVKDLSYLNRDLSKVIMIDTDPSVVRKQPENAIILPPWDGSPSDRGLVRLIPFLEYIHAMEYDDVRRILKSFEGKDIADEFARREAKLRLEHEKKHGHRGRGGRSFSSSSSSSSAATAAGSLFGLRPDNMSLTMQPDGEQSTSEAFAQGKMLQDIVRERGQRNYEIMARSIRENGDKWLQEEKEMMDKLQKEAMESAIDSVSSSVSGFFGGLFGGDEGSSNNSSDKNPNANSSKK